ncbi:hypothetical protein ABTY98_05205 [Streptomyces sp. NPDC096040]|uniref:hypothetical protein n=1 Tax=Streptomyces sp. NPDC096040 TaxID=3155541 RepID=UPI00332D9B33
MGLRDFARSLKPGDDRALAVELRDREQTERAAAIKAMSDRDARRTPEEVAASRERGRRSKRGPVEQPRPGINP